MGLALQFLGAVGILLPFALFQLGRMSQHGYAYLSLNLVGSTVLTAVAYLDGQWGFVILQGVWSLAAAASIGRRLLRPRPRPRRWRQPRQPPPRRRSGPPPAARR